jgi:hypothetical protein
LASVRQAAQTGAAIGREFSYLLLRIVAPFLKTNGNLRLPV